MNGIAEDFTKNLTIFAQKQVPKAVSIYLPSGTTQEGTIAAKAALKNALNQAEDQLIKLGIRDLDAKLVIKSARKALHNKELWSHRKKGIAVFVSEEFYKAYALDREIEPLVLVQDYFYITPLVSYLDKPENYYILGIGSKNSSLYLGSYHNLDLIYTEKIPLTARRLIQMRNSEEKNTDNNRNLVKKYLRSVNMEVNDRAKDKDLYLVLVTEEYIQSLYTSVNSFPNILNDFVNADPEYLDESEISHRVWQLITNTNKEANKESIKKYRSLLHTQKAVTNIKEIVTKSYQARLEALFVEQNEKIWGCYDSDNNTVQINSEKQPDDEELLNLSLINTIRSGGKIFTADKIGKQGPPFTGILKF